MNKWTELSRVRLRRVFSAVFPVADKMERGLRRDKVKYAWECNLTVREPAEETGYKRLPRGRRAFFCDNSVIIEMKYQRGYCAEFNEADHFIQRERTGRNIARVIKRSCSRAKQTTAVYGNVNGNCRCRDEAKRRGGRAGEGKKIKRRRRDATATATRDHPVWNKFFERGVGEKWEK